MPGTEEGLKQAELQLEGVLSQRIGVFKEQTLDILAEIEAQVDFPEDEIGPIAKEGMVNRINSLHFGLYAICWKRMRKAASSSTASKPPYSASRT